LAGEGRGRGGASSAAAPLDTLIRLNEAETALVVVIPFVAVLMVRGHGYSESVLRAELPVR
jgi:uncharacterized membrane protein